LFFLFQLISYALRYSWHGCNCRLCATTDQLSSTKQVPIALDSDSTTYHCVVLRAVRSGYFLRHPASTLWQSEPVLSGLRTQYFVRHRSQYFSGHLCGHGDSISQGTESVFCVGSKPVFPGDRASIFRGTEPVLCVNTKPVFPEARS